MINEHEVYIKRETADLLKTAGYNWTTPQGYLSSSGLLTSGYFSNNSDYGIAAPTLEVAQRWLREVKNISVEIERYETPNPLARELFEVVYEKTVEKSFAYTVNVIDANNESIYDSLYFDTYEEAQENGIINALKELINGQNS